MPRTAFSSVAPANSPVIPVSPVRAGIGLRTAHYSAAWDARPRLGFIEVHSENYFGAGGQPLDWLARFRSEYSLSLHGVGMGLGSAPALDAGHLARLKHLVDRFEPALVSEHICWGRVEGAHLNDLLPLPYTEEALAHIVNRVDEVQVALGRTILVENVSSYLQFAHSSIPEWEFVAELAHRAGCGILLDVNNVYVNAVNHGFDARAFLTAIPEQLVGEIHLAGHDKLDDAECLIDTHGTAVCDAVWDLYAETIARMGPKPTLIEWDTDLPSLGTLLGEAAKADAILNHHDAGRAAA